MLNKLTNNKKFYKMTNLFENNFLKEVNKFCTVFGLDCDKEFDLVSAHFTKKLLKEIDS
jgi:hypothetical protein